MASGPPQVRLGTLVPGGLSPAILAIVERGVLRRPELATGLSAEIHLEMHGYPPVRVWFDEHDVIVEDGPAKAPDLKLSGSLPDLVSMLVAPTIGGVPNPVDRRGLAVLGLLAQRRVRVEGSFVLLRRVMRAIRI